MVEHAVRPPAVDPESGKAVAVLDAIKLRRSAKSFRPDPVPAALLEQAIDAARWAPNHHLTEPWRFFILTGDARARLGEALAREVLEDRPGDAKAEAEAIGLRTKLVRAPVLIVVAQTGISADGVRNDEDYAACACATQNLLLAAHALGLAAKWSTGKMVTSAAVRDLLGLDAADRIVAYVYLGLAGSEPLESRRRPAADVARWLAE